MSETWKVWSEREPEHGEICRVQSWTNEGSYIVGIYNKFNGMIRRLDNNVNFRKQYFTTEVLNDNVKSLVF